MNQNNSRRTSKRLTFRNKNTVDGTNHFKQTTYDNLTADNGNIGHLVSSIINTDTLTATNGKIANINMNYDHNTNTSIIHAPNNLAIKINDGPNLITIRPDGQINIGESITTTSINASDGKFTNDIEANNMSLIGDFVSTNANITGQLKVNGDVDSTNIRTNNIDTTGISAVDGIYKNNLIIANNLAVGAIVETSQISSLNDLTLSIPIGYTINVPNIRYNINITNNRAYGPIELKLSKIFIATTNVSLRADITCDGIEIIIYNQSIKSISVNDPKFIIKIAPKTAQKMVYINLVQTWILI